MSSIRCKDTKPELTIRKILWSHGIRYRIHDSDIIGKPDISFKKRKLAIFIDGCFWHACKKCYNEPKTNILFWRKKILGNKLRRKSVRKKLRMDGWKILQFWEHDIKIDSNKIVKEIEKNLGS